MNPENLRKKKPGKQPKWTVEEISAGLEYFKELHGRYPGSREIDLFEFLPTSRSIQRSHDGLPQLREKLGFDLSQIDQTKGVVRSEKAKAMYKNSIQYEEEFYNFLVSKISEVRVHEHKILRPGHVCCDFFIYTSDKNGYAIDIFYAQDLFTLQRILRIKLLRYSGLPYKVYFVLVGNNTITQKDIDALLENRKIVWPGHIAVLTESVFKKIF